MAKIAPQVLKMLKEAVDDRDSNRKYISVENDMLISTSPHVTVVAIVKEVGKMSGFYTKNFDPVDTTLVKNFDFPAWRKFVPWQDKALKTVVLSNKIDIVSEIFNNKRQVNVLLLSKLPNDAECHIMFYDNKVTLFYPEFNMFVVMRTSEVDPNLGIKSNFGTIDDIMYEIGKGLDIQLKLDMDE